MKEKVRCKSVENTGFAVTFFLRYAVPFIH